VGNFSQSLQYLKDRIIAVEKELKDTSADIRRELKTNFKILMGLLVLEAVLTLGALGMPLKEIIPSVMKLFLG
jgi:hypothetical protein